MSFNFKLKTLQLTNHLLALIGAGYLYTSHDWIWLVPALLGYWYFGIVGVDIGFHRYASHRAFETGPIRRMLLLASTIPAGLGSTISWCAMHRFHHLHSDTELDPHSPAHSAWKAWFTFYAKSKIPTHVIKDLLRDPAHQFIHRHYFKISAFLYVLLALADWRAPIFLLAIPAIGCFHGLGAVVVLCHKWGYQNHATNDRSFNNYLAAALSLGEGWHNNHHANPSAWRQGERFWEFDPPAFVIKMFFAVSKPLPYNETHAKERRD